MYITDKYWNHYLGDTEDSLTLIDYLADKRKEELTLGEIFSDLGFDQRDGNFTYSEDPITIEFQDMGEEYEDFYIEFYFAIDVMANLAAILLECKKNGSVDLRELSGDDLETPAPVITLTSTQKEDDILNQALKDFAAEPMDFDLSEMCSEEDMMKMAAVCEELRKELYGE